MRFNALLASLLIFQATSSFGDQLALMSAGEASRAAEFINNLIDHSPDGAITVIDYCSKCHEISEHSTATARVYRVSIAFTERTEAESDVRGIRLVAVPIADAVFTNPMAEPVTVTPPAQTEPILLSPDLAYLYLEPEHQAGLYVVAGILCEFNQLDINLREFRLLLAKTPETDAAAIRLRTDLTDRLITVSTYSFGPLRTGPAIIERRGKQELMIIDEIFVIDDENNQSRTVITGRSFLQHTPSATQPTPAYVSITNAASKPVSRMMMLDGEDRVFVHERGNTFLHRSYQYFEPVSEIHLNQEWMELLYP